MHSLHRLRRKRPLLYSPPIAFLTMKQIFLAAAATVTAALLPSAASAQYFGYGYGYGNYGYGRVTGPNGSYGTYQQQSIGNQTFTNYQYNSGGYQQQIRCNTSYLSGMSLTNCY